MTSGNVNDGKWVTKLLQANASYNSYTETNNPLKDSWTKSGYVPDNIFYKDGEVVKVQTGGGDEAFYQKILEQVFGFK